MPEVCFTTTISKEENLIYVWDIKTGVLLSSWKGNNSKSIALITNNQEMLPTVLSPQDDKPLIQAFCASKQSVAQKSIAPEKIECVKESNSGIYLMGGGVSGRLYLWHLITGVLIRMWDAHYKAITKIKFTADDSRVISSSLDGSIHVFEMASLVNTNQKEMSPILTFADHSLPVTDIHVGLGLGYQARLFSVSLDRTCRIHEASGQTLSSILFPRSLTCITVDTCESFLFCGAADGKIYRSNMYSNLSNSVADDSANIFDKHTKQVTAISLSFDETLLVSSSLDTTCIVWDPQSRAALRVFKQLKGPAMTCTLSCFWDPNMETPFRVMNRDGLVMNRDGLVMNRDGLVMNRDGLAAQKGGKKNQLQVPLDRIPLVGCADSGDDVMDSQIALEKKEKLGLVACYPSNKTSRVKRFRTYAHDLQDEYETEAFSFGVKEAVEIYREVVGDKDFDENNVDDLKKQIELLQKKNTELAKLNQELCKNLL